MRQSVTGADTYISYALKLSSSIATVSKDAGSGSAFDFRDRLERIRRGASAIQLFGSFNALRNGLAEDGTNGASMDVSTNRAEVGTMVYRPCADQSIAMDCLRIDFKSARIEPANNFSSSAWLRVEHVTAIWGSPSDDLLKQ